MEISSILDVWLGSEYASEKMFHPNLWFRNQQKYLCKTN